MAEQPQREQLSYNLLKEKTTLPPHDCQLLRFNTLDMLESNPGQAVMV